MKLKPLASNDIENLAVNETQPEQSVSSGTKPEAIETDQLALNETEQPVSNRIKQPASN